MDDRHDQDQGKPTGENTEPAAANASPAGETPASAESSAASQLPMIESPQLGGGEAEDVPAAERLSGTPIKSITALPARFREPLNGAPRASAAAGPGPQQRSFRFALLAATIAGAAGIGALAGSLAAFSLGHQTAAQATVTRTAESSDVMKALKSQRAELSALKTSLDSESRSTTAQFARIADKFNNIERAQADQADKLTHIADAVDRFGKKPAPEITGSIAAPAPVSAPAIRPAAAAPVLHDWIVQDVRNGRAMVETRYGSMFLVASGGTLPGLGRVAEIKRQNGEWVVVTERGLITSSP